MVSQLLFAQSLSIGCSWPHSVTFSMGHTSISLKSTGNSESDGLSRPISTPFLAAFLSRRQEIAYYYGLSVQESTDVYMHSLISSQQSFPDCSMKSNTCMNKATWKVKTKFTPVCFTIACWQTLPSLIATYYSEWSGVVLSCMIMWPVWLCDLLCCPLQVFCFIPCNLSGGKVESAAPSPNPSPRQAKRKRSSSRSSVLSTLVVRVFSSLRWWVWLCDLFSRWCVRSKALSFLRWLTQLMLDNWKGYASRRSSVSTTTINFMI